MPITIDLPPPNIKIESTKIEHIKNEGRLYSPKIDFATLKLDRNLFDDFYLKNKFNSLVQLWEENTAFESSISNIIEEDNFKKILDLDSSAIPLIIDQIEKEPSVLVWALNIITGKSMSSTGRETIEEVCKKWVKAYRRGQIKAINN